MFDLLKKKIGSFVDKIAKKEEHLASGESSVPVKQELEEKIEGAAPAVGRELVEPEPIARQEEKPAGPLKPRVEEPEPEVVGEPVQVPEQAKEEPEPVAEEPGPAPVEKELPPPEPEPVPEPAPKPVPEKKVERAPEPEQVEKKAAAQKQEPVKRGVGVNLGIGSRLKQAVLGQVEIKESDVDELLFEFELAMLESDVAYDVAKGICEDMKNRLVGMRVGREDVSKAVKSAMRESIIDYVTAEKPDITGGIRQKNESGEPYVILFVGPNGHGKTTTIAKFANWLSGEGFKCIFSASDTFRAGSIQQLEVHAKRLGIPMVKHAYGADPSAVAYDAKNAAKARGLDVVLVDSAGRQETNKGLIDEMKKISRVIAPDLKVYIAESIVGNSIVEQIREFNKAIELDGVILTKVDVDAKGGTVLSIAKTVNKPILFVGTGQEYGDLMEFEPEWLVSNVMP